MVSDGVLIALIGAIASVVSVIATGVLGLLLAVVNRKAKRAANAAETAVGQLENGHVEDPGKTSNIRDEISENHEETKLLISQVRFQVSALARLVHHTVGRVDDQEAELNEMTGPKPGHGKHKGEMRA